MALIRSENLVHNAACAILEGARQTAVAAATSQAEIDAIETTFYQAVVVSCLANSCSPDQYRVALQEIGDH